MSLLDFLTKPYDGFRKSFLLYWENYGGFTSLIRSPYLHFALIFTFLALPFWTTEHDPLWYEVSLAIIPSILGFTLGGYAILLAFGDERFRQLISGKEKDDTSSPFMGVNSTFVHFILVQVVAILAAIFASAWQLKSGIFALFGFFLFSYSILTAAAAAMAVLRVAHWFDIWKTRKGSKPSE